MTSRTQATELIKGALAAHGRVTLTCDSCNTEAYVDHDYNTEDVERVANLIDHATYSHASARDVLAVVYTSVLSTEAMRDANSL